MKEPKGTPERSALRTTLIYAVVAGLWIFFSDRLVGYYFPNDQQITVSIIKGLGFVGFTALLLYLLVKKDLEQIYRAEAEWRVLFDSANDSIYIFRLRDNGLPGAFIDVNKTAVKLLGYSRSEMMKLTPWDLTKPEVHGDMQEFLNNLQTDGHATTECSLITKDGHEIPVEVSSRALTFEDTTAVVVIARDVTERRKAEEERRQAAIATEMDKRKFYKETILAVTSGKFELGDHEEAKEWVQKHDLAIDVSEPQQVAEARRSVMDYCMRQGLSQESTGEFELAVGEALANAIKHAKQGMIYAGRTVSSVWVGVSDEGKGIDTFALPKVALLSGFTTKASMGLGYTLILEVSDHVKLATGPSGTTVVMEKRLKDLTEIDERIAAHFGIK